MNKPFADLSDAELASAMDANGSRVILLEGKARRLNRRTARMAREIIRRMNESGCNEIKLGDGRECYGWREDGGAVLYLETFEIENVAPNL